MSQAAEASGRASRRDRKRAKTLLKEVHRLTRKHHARVPEPERKKLDAAIERVEGVLAADGAELGKAVDDLEYRVDKSLGFAKKSATREYAESLAVAVLIALLLRAFVVEAFKIPTGSMIPTLQIGDHIFVNKFLYGLRVPFTNAWLTEWGTPQRGDVIVFRFPRDQSKDFIKRVVAVAGDEVRVQGRQVYVNDGLLKKDPQPKLEYVEEGEGTHNLGLRVDADAYTEHGGDTEYTVLWTRTDDRDGWPRPGMPDLPGLDCGEAVRAPARCVVEPGYVFVMGDNRDNSQDSREWGGVPVTLVKGKAMFVWWSYGPRSGVRWGRFGHLVR